MTGGIDAALMKVLISAPVNVKQCCAFCGVQVGGDQAWQIVDLVELRDVRGEAGIQGIACAPCAAAGRALSPEGRAAIEQFLRARLAEYEAEYLRECEAELAADPLYRDRVN
jgi:hypothetical protein